MVRTLEEIQADPARVRVTVDVELSQVGTAAQANRIQVLEGELAEALEKVRLYDLDRHTEQRRADEFRAELARRTEERDEREAARRKLEEGANLALNERNRATAALARIQAKVWERALDEPVERRADEDTITRNAAILVDAVAFVRATTGKPE
jgi:hypothetical protein